MTDHEFDYRQIYPNANAKRDRLRSQNPKRPKQEPAKPKYAFVDDEPRKPARPKAQHAEEQRPRPKPVLQRINGRLVDENRKSMPTMESAIQQLLATDLNIKTREIIAKLEAKGYEVSPISVSVIKEKLFKLIRLMEKNGQIDVLAWRD
jgi:hypothetical protein